MAATHYKNIRVCVGTSVPYAGAKPVKRYREIGIMIKHEVNGNEWLEPRFHADILNPVLFQQCKANSIPQGG